MYDKVEQLALATAAGYRRRVTALLAGGVNPNALGSTGCAPLHWACQEGHVEIVKLLIKHGAKVKMRDDHGFSPLMIAAGGGNARLVNILLSAGAQVGERCAANGGSTALIHAAAWNRVSVARTLLKWGAKPGSRDKAKRTPLFFAAISGYPEMAELLIKHGARLDLRFKDLETGKTVQQLIKKAKDKRFVKLLMTQSR